MTDCQECGALKQERDQARRYAVEVAKALLSLADTAGMPDTYKDSDRRTRMARNVIKRWGDS